LDNPNPAIKEIAREKNKLALAYKNTLLSSQETSAHRNLLR
jgi:hypothetical protein